MPLPTVNGPSGDEQMLMLEAGLFVPAKLFWSMSVRAGKLPSMVMIPAKLAKAEAQMLLSSRALDKLTLETALAGVRGAYMSGKAAIISSLTSWKA